MGLLGSVFNFIDPILDKIDPAHNYVQEWTTGSKTTEGQSPYFETIFPMVVDGFFPGVGSAIGAVDKGSNGNWTGAGISALGAMYGLSSLGAAPSTAGAGISAGEGVGVGAANAGADTAGSGLTLSSGQGFSGGDYSTFAGADSFGSGITSSTGVASPELVSMGASGTAGYSDLAKADRAIEVPNSATGSQPGANWKYYDNGVAISPEGRYYLNGEMVTGSGGQSKGILDYATEYGGKAGRAINSKEAQQAMKMGGAAMATDQKLRAQQMAQQQMMPRPVEAPEFGANSGRQVRSFQEISPYSNFNGGFNPRRMSRSGLLG